MKFKRKDRASNPSESSSEPKSSTESALWIDNPPTSKLSQHRWQAAITAGVVAACLALVAIPIGIALTSKSTSNASSHRVRNGFAEHRVLQALSATTNSGSFDMAYRLLTSSSQSPTNQPTCGLAQSPNSLPPSTRSCNPNRPESLILGVATIDTNPFAMKATFQIG